MDIDTPITTESRPEKPLWATPKPMKQRNPRPKATPKPKAQRTSRFAGTPKPMKQRAVRPKATPKPRTRRPPRTSEPTDTTGEQPKAAPKKSHKKKLVATPRLLLTPIAEGLANVKNEPSTTNDKHTKRTSVPAKLDLPSFEGEKVDRENRWSDSEDDTNWCTTK